MTETKVLLNSPEEIMNFVRTVSKFNCDFDLQAGPKCVDAKSIIGVMSLNCKNSMNLVMNTEGELADKVLESIMKYVV